jgi:hypothetical protein
MEKIIGLILASVVVWLIITTAVFFQFIDLECIKYSDWESIGDRKQIRECVLYQPNSEATNE